MAAMRRDFLPQALDTAAAIEDDLRRARGAAPGKP
jgi:hypothetical protein